MYLVDEQHIIRLERGKQSGEIAGLIKYRTGGNLESHSQLVGDNITQGRLAESRRAEQEHMVEALAAKLGSLDEDLKVADDLRLSGKVGKTQRAQGIVLLLLTHLLADIKITHCLKIKDRFTERL